MYVFRPITKFKYIFHVKFNFLWFKSLTRIRIRIRLYPHCYGFLDPDPYQHWDKKSWIRIRIRIEANADPQHWKNIDIDTKLLNTFQTWF